VTGMTSSIMVVDAFLTSTPTQPLALSLDPPRN
jgi:hypothetical protein